MSTKLLEKIDEALRVKLGGKTFKLGKDKAKKTPKIKDGWVDWNTSPPVSGVYLVESPNGQIYLRMFVKPNWPTMAWSTIYKYRWRPLTKKAIKESNFSQSDIRDAQEKFNFWVETH